jgi:preprotein translocase subunit SecA
MDILETIGDIAGSVFGGIGSRIERAITSVFGSSNARYIKRLQPKVEAINRLENRYVAMSDAELRAQTEIFRERLKQGETLDDILVEAFAVCREAGRRWLNMRHYDVQLIGGMVLHSGAIAEMVTGEGKTLVATLPAYLNALGGKGVHVVTVNDYLARRDMEWMGPLYLGLGLTVGAIYADMDPQERHRSYGSDITYGTNNEFGFDYLRDNMKDGLHGDNRFPVHRQQVQRELNYAVIDEVDNILIDEARTPLIISGPAHDDVTKYAKADRVARLLKKDVHFEVKEKEHTCHLNDEGVREAERLAGVESFYTAGNMEWPHLIDNALKAHHLYQRDVRYVVEDNQVIIVDEFTGRKMPGRQWSDGLHQAVEAKEGVTVKEETQTLATITLQNFFKLYKKIAGMTGTAMTEASEFWKIYKLDVIAIPTNKTLVRVNHHDVIYLGEKDKFEAIANEIERINRWDVVVLRNGEEVWGELQRQDEKEVVILPKGSKNRRSIPRSEIGAVEPKGRPILVGTVSIEKSERLSSLLGQRGIKHEVLNAKHHKREAEIVAQAGRKGGVTIATNMAGRGTDIILGGNPDTMAWAQLQDKYASRLDVPRSEWDQLVTEIEQREKMKEEGREVAGMGGLHVIGTERHEARRIDNQLRGRCGRQGDPGSSRFYLSLEDDLMRIFAGDWVRSVLQRLGMKPGEAIESRMVSRRIEGAQKKVEERNFEIRKNLLEYDEVMDEQRKRVYGYRQRILEGANCKDLILDFIYEQINRHVDEFLHPDYGPATFCKWIGTQLRLESELKPHDFRDVDLETAQRLAKDEAARAVESVIHEELEQHLPEDVEDQSEWNWEAVATMANSRWKLSVRDRDLKKIGRENLAEHLIEQANKAIEAVDLSEGAKFLHADFGLLSACGWAKYKFNIDVTPDELRNLDAAEAKALLRRKAEATYEEKETEYPVMAGLYHFTTRDGQGHKRYDREQLVGWARERFQVDLTLEDLKNKQREEIQAVLIASSRRRQQDAQAAIAEAKRRIERLFPTAPPDDAPIKDALRSASTGSSNGAFKSLADWLRSDLHCEVTAEDLGRLKFTQFKNRVIGAVEDHYRPEIRSMERQLLLHLLDSAWKEHLLNMDHLRSGIGLVGYAQKDPKVEYKREGMRAFREMWTSVGEQVTDLVFRMERLDEGFVSSTWAAAEARHDEAASVSEIAQQQQSALAASQGERKLEPIRNRAERVGRNDPCPCGSGKKFKQCCGRRVPA